MSKSMLITGTSSGIGLAIAKAAIASGWNVIGVSRKAPAENLGARYTHHTADLVDPSTWDHIPMPTGKEVVLVNNAGMLGPMEQAVNVGPEGAGHTYTLNVLCPMHLTARFIRETTGQKQVWNTGSGAGATPIEGWSVYCGTKAALHMYTAVVATENPDVLVRVFRPGKVDTPMQSEIRATDAAGFPHLEYFVAAFETGDLNTPQMVGEAVVKGIENPAIVPGVDFSITEIA